MKISFVYSPNRTEANVLRMLDGERRSLIVMAAWRQPPVETFMAIRSQLTDSEATEVKNALGLDVDHD
jgi:hypothetical protein